MASRICSAASAQASHLGEAVSLEAFRHLPVSGTTTSSHRECPAAHHSPLPSTDSNWPKQVYERGGVANLGVKLEGTTHASAPLPYAEASF
ncbi:hypothetical protein HMPREF9344_01357 [Cutibacterium acnes HL097PA1]|nr:hypothetical protein HMPREF9344_01357 [Cutibacterium acnes HL097PA1]